MKGNVKTSKALNYFQESYQELRKVTWPTRNQAVRLTFLVLVFCLVAAAVVGVLDLAFSYGYRTLVNLAPPPAVVSSDVTTSTTPESAQPVTVTPTDVSVTPVTDSTTPSTTTQPSDPGVTVTPVTDAPVTDGGTQQ